MYATTIAVVLTILFARPTRIIYKMVLFTFIFKQINFKLYFDDLKIEFQYF